MATKHQGVTVVTGASADIGLELAKVCARQGFDLILVAGEPAIEAAAQTIRDDTGVAVQSVQADLATGEGVEQVLFAIGDRPVDALLVDTGCAMGRAFLDQEWADVHRAIDTNVLGMMRLIHRLGAGMRERGAGRILITGSVPGSMPGMSHAAYGASAAFLDSFSRTLRTELQGCGVTVSCLLPRSPAADWLEHTEVDASRPVVGGKADPEFVSRATLGVMAPREGLTGWMTNVRVALASVAPAAVTARLTWAQARPRSARK